MAENYEVTMVEEWTFLNARGNPVEGYRVSFTTTEGIEGYVTVARSKMSKEAVAEAISAEMEKLEGVLGL